MTDPAAAWRRAFLALAFVVTMISYADRQIIALLKPVFDQEFGWTGSDYSLITTGFQAAIAVSLLGTGWFLDRVGLKFGFAAGLAGWSLAAMLHAAARSIGQFLSARIALGVCESVATPAAVKGIATFFRAEDRTLALGVLNIAPNIAAAITPLIVGWLFGGLGWQWTILIIGGAGFFCLILWFALPIDRMMGTTTAPTTTDDPPIGLLKDRRVWALGLAKFVTDQAWWFMLFWLPDFFHRRYGLDLAHVGPPLAIVYGMAALGSLLGGILPGLLPRLTSRPAMRRDQARKATMALFAVTVLPIACVLLVDDPWAAVFIVGLALASHQGFATNIFATAADVFPPGRVGRIVGFAAFCGNVGGTLALSVTGWILETWGSLLPMFIACAAAYPIAWVILQILAPAGRGAATAESGSELRQLHHALQGGAALGRHAHRDGDQPVPRSHRDRRAAGGGVEEGAPLIKGRAVMVTRLQGGAIDRHMSALHRLWRADRNPGAEFDHASRDADLQLCGVPDRGHLFLLLGTLGEHAQIEHRANAVGEIHHGIGVVDDVRNRAVIGFVAVIDIHCAGAEHPNRLRRSDQPHQVEEMATFLHHRAAGVGVETIPVPNLLQERKPMFGHADPDEAADFPGRDLRDETGDRRHVAIFHTDPEDSAMPRRPFGDPARIRDRGRHRLFA